MIKQPLFVALLTIPFLAAPILYLLGRTSLRKGRVWGMSLARILTLLVLAGEMVLTYLNVRTSINSSGVMITVGQVDLLFDGVNLILTSIVLVLGFCVTLFSIPYMAKEKGEEKFYALLLMTIGSIIGLGASFDLFNLWVWFEAMAISTYFLVAFYNEQPASLEAGVKYLVQSAVGSALVLFGIAGIYVSLGTTSLTDLSNYSSMIGGFGIIGVVLMIVGFGVKAALVPLHTWLPDAHSQAPSGISAMLSGIVIEAGLVAMLRTISMVAGLGVNWGLILIVFACLNILVGNLMALRQTEVKRLLAYSSLAHVGYMLFGFGVAFAFSSINSVTGAFFHMITHALMKGLAFLAAGALLYALHLAKEDHSPLTLDDLNGASRKYPLIAVGLSIAVLSLAGLPPFAGFMSKWMILVGAVETQNPWMIGLVVFVALNSVLSLAYYAPIVNRLFKRETSAAVENGARVSWLMSLPVVLLSLLILLLGVWPTVVNFFYNFSGMHLLYYFVR